MSSGGSGEEKQWSCGKSGIASLQRMSSMVRDIGEPCLSQSPIKVIIAVGRMLKPDKWQATFDNDGKVSGFQRALKLIVLGGVDPSIRPEVWEFLLGCYQLTSTAEYRRQLRIARRERYEDLIRQCQMMHSSIGTGELAFVVGSKVMDMRASKDDRKGEAKDESKKSPIDSTPITDTVGNCRNLANNCMDTSFECGRDSSSDSIELNDVREKTDSATFDNYFVPESGPLRSSSRKREDANGLQYDAEGYFDFPALPVINLFDKRGEEYNKERADKLSIQRKLRFEDDRMHSFEINNNRELIMEPNGSQSNSLPRASHHNNSEIEMVHCDEHGCASCSNNIEKEILNGFRISDAPQTSFLPTSATTSQGVATHDNGESEWLWTLHCIVVDVVRTDSHLEFYEDQRNLARMSDILAVYAWVDPATGYCQGMSDLLSPFVVLFEDDADAFWCFEMLLRRMRENFQMEGPTGVMKQLQALWHILELTDREIFAHLLHIGAESLHFAFRMLMVLFRRELSFTEVLQMWEMMWAVDFDESTAGYLEENCLEALVVHPPRDSGGEMKEEFEEVGNNSVKDGSHTKNRHAEHSTSYHTGMKADSSHPLCGLTRNFWAKSGHLQISNVVSSTKNGDDELPVFCVAAILIINRHKIIRETRSIDDMIKVFNDKVLKIHVKRCIRTAIKLRKKYFYKLLSASKFYHSELVFMSEDAKLRFRLDRVLLLDNLGGIVND